jgi:hypothetical protein
MEDGQRGGEGGGGKSANAHVQGDQKEIPAGEVRANEIPALGTHDPGRGNGCGWGGGGWVGVHRYPPLHTHIQQGGGKT